MSYFISCQPYDLGRREGTHGPPKVAVHSRSRVQLTETIEELCHATIIIAWFRVVHRGSGHRGKE